MKTLLALALGGLLAVSAAAASAQMPGPSIAAASRIAMQHAQETGTTVYGVTATTVDFNRDGYDELFSIYSLNNQFSVPVASFVVYFTGGPNGFLPQQRVQLVGTSPRFVSNEFATITFSSETPQGLVNQTFQVTPSGLVPN